MNRVFAANFTPARARLLSLMQSASGVDIDPVILERAHEGRITSEQFAQVGITEEMDRIAIQFIHDMNFRVGLPADLGKRKKINGVLGAALKIAGLENPVSTEIGRGIYADLLPLRNRVVVIDLDPVGRAFMPFSSFDLVSKLCPKLIAVGSMVTQYAFSVGSTYSTSSKMGEILYPRVANSLKNSPYKKTDTRTLLAMGIFPGYIGDPNNAPKKFINFCVPATFEY